MIVQQQISSKSSFGYGFKPKQIIPETQKTEDWANENIDWCISMAPINWRSKVDGYYARYNGERNTEQFNHITKTYGIEFPAGKLKHIPLTRPLINRILSEVEERMFEFTAHSEDNESIQQKIKSVSSNIIQEIFSLVGSDADPGAEVEKIRRYYQEEYQSELEIAVQHFLNQYIYKHRMDRQFSDAFLDKAISGQEFYRVKVNRIGEDPDFEVIKPGTLFYADNATKWVSECDWAVRPIPMTPTEIIDKYGERLKSDDIKKLESWLDMYHKDAFYRLNNVNDIDAVFNSVSDVSVNLSNAAVNHKVIVYQVEWKSIRKVYYLKNPNKYVDDEDAAFLKILSNEDLRELPASRRERVRVGYVQDLWEGVRIGDDIYCDQGKVKYPVRSMSFPSKVYLSFNGLTHNGRIKPYSLIGETEDLQDLYDILHYHKENLIALSGVAGSYMDLSQLPDFKTGNPADNLKMFLYYKKMGTAFIDRSKAGADKNFNQFPSYNETIGAGMEAILSVIQHIEDVAGRVIGINRQQLGQNAYFDGKATMEQTIQNSSMMTEYIINQHDEFVERALTDIANAARISYKNGIVGHYTDKNRMQQIFRLDSVNFPFADWGIHITNRSSDKRSVMELRAMSVQLIKQGLMQVEDILPMYKQTSLAEITRQIRLSAAKRADEIAAQQQQLQQIEMQLKQAREESEIKKLQAQVEEIMGNLQLNQQELQLEQQALASESATDNSKLELEKKRVDLEAKQLEVYAKQNAVRSAEVRNK